MEPFSIHTKRLVLNLPRSEDVPDIVTYCADPIFERFMSTPWPYELHHAESFIEDVVPALWADDKEWNWAIRTRTDGPILGMIGMRLRSQMIGYWIGAPHRGQKFMSEAGAAVLDTIFERTDLSEVLWECVQGNVASARVAQQLGFEYTGEVVSLQPNRIGDAVPTWTARRSRTAAQAPAPAWPT